MLSPETEAELAEIVGGTKEPLAVQGGGTKGMTPDGLPLTTSALSGVTLYEPGALTVVAQAGTPLSKIEAVLDAENQRLAFEPMDYRGLLGTTGEPTVGGVVAANVSGPRRVAVGACRDFALGVRYVDGSGQIIKNGGRVMKNVTGYDLVKLMSGARGTLGVLTEVSLKVLPKPETDATVILHAPSDMHAAVHAMSTALGSPYDVTGAAFVPSDNKVFIRVEGFTDSVAYRAGKLRDALTELGDVDIENGSAKIWTGLRDVDRLHDAEGDVWRISVKPTDAPDIAARLEADDCLFDWGGGLIWALVPVGTDLRTRLEGFEGHATLVRADAGTRTRLGMFQPEAPAVAALSAGLRARFDPRNIFNRGLMDAA